ncbi:polyketide cyclase [Leucobacter sp. UCD-THU]|uniref:SRPBCC family protein n=1 Tax=Leucobacter sp. UCD-THU TaxID=1292023 RepID=UPI0003806F70|nr:SRPBCC family protein [Leucobacter sp. UCD-THU]EYT56817.1 polyketide cyclase [Leucobacter sp. UCD-THU]
MTTTETRTAVTRIIDAPTKAIFNLLTLPARHPEFDGSGMVRSDEKSQRIQGVGDVFVMNMHRDAMGDYQMHNHVTAYDENKMVGWQPAQARNPDEPDGWEWLYELEAIDSGSTRVTLTYDWSRVTDPQLVPIFPAVSEEQLEESLNLLAAAVSDA